MEKNQVQLLADLEKLVEENQFVAHAYSILETEEITDKVGIKNYSSGFYNSWLLGLYALRPSTFLSFNRGFICEHLIFVQYKTVTKINSGFNNIFLGSSKFYKNRKFSEANF